MTDLLTLRSPIPLPKLVPTLDFKKIFLPMALKDYVFDVSHRIKCPPDFVAITAMCALSSLIGKKIRVKPKKNDDWTLSVNLWGCLIGEPSSMKTPSINAALLPIREIEKTILIEFQKTEKENRKKRHSIDIKNKKIKKEASKLLESDGEEAMENHLNNLIDEPPAKRKRLVINDSSYEKLGEILSENENGLLLFRDELSSWLTKIYKEEYQAERSFYLELYNGNNSYICDRIQRGSIFVKNAMISVIGGLQPSIISPLIDNAKSGVTDDGLLQRLQLSVWPPEKKWEWIDEKPNLEAYKSYKKVFDRFYDMQEDSYIFGLTEDAQSHFKIFMEKIHTLVNGDINNAFKAYILKLPKTIISLALIIQLSDNFESSLMKKQIELDAFNQALFWVDYLISHARKIYSSENSILIAAHSIIENLHKFSGEFTASQLQKKGWKGLNDKDLIEKALDLLIEYDHLIPRLQISDKGGRPTTYYKKNFIEA